MGKLKFIIFLYIFFVTSLASAKQFEYQRISGCGLIRPYDLNESNDVDNREFQAMMSQVNEQKYDINAFEFPQGDVFLVPSSNIQATVTQFCQSQGHECALAYRYKGYKRFEEWASDELHTDSFFSYQKPVSIIGGESYAFIPFQHRITMNTCSGNGAAKSKGCGSIRFINEVQCLKHHED